MGTDCPPSSMPRASTLLHVLEVLAGQRARPWQQKPEAIGRNPPSFRNRATDSALSLTHAAFKPTATCNSTQKQVDKRFATRCVLGQCQLARAEWVAVAYDSPI